jgi:hypothetical protein
VGQALAQAEANITDESNNQTDIPALITLLKTACADPVYRAIAT